MSLESDLVLNALAAVAADPAGWEELLDVLPAGDEVTGPPSGLEAPWTSSEALARRLRLPGEGVQAAEPEPAWVALSMQGRVVAANAAGAAAFAEFGQAVVGEPIRWRRDANDTLATAGLKRARATDGKVILRLERGAGEPPRFAFATPLARLPAFSGAARPANAHELACLVFPADDGAARLWGLMRDSFGLTSAEVRVAQKLRSGLSLQQVADDLGVSLNTVRNQLRSIFDKMGVQRQSELVHALSELASLDRALETSSRAGPPADTPVLRRAVLADGRHLAYRDYGAPDGRPVVMMHEGLGSSLLPPGTDGRAAALGLRIVAPERPGFGQSDPRPDYGFATVAADMAELVGRLDLRRPIVSGFASGSAFALHLGHRLGAEAAFVMVTTGRAPGRRAAVANPFHRFRRALEAHPWAAEAMFRILRLRGSQPLTRQMLRRLTDISPADAATLAENPWIPGYMWSYVAETLARSARGPAEDIRAFGAERGRAPDLACPLVVWHGADDRIAPAADFLAYLGAPPAELRLIEGAGHLMAFRHRDEIFQRLSEPPPA